MEAVSDKRPLSDLLRETWMSVLGVISSAESELGRLAGRWIEIVGHPKEEAQNLVQELQQRMRANRLALERRVEEGVRAATDRLFEPVVADLDRLKARLDVIDSRLAEARRRKER